jgi:DNA-binding response OmpR family regulator
MPRIFLVEDDVQLRPMLKELLTSSGYEVWEFKDGRGVAEMYQQQRPDLVIIDLLMPEKEGLEVIMDLRRRDRNVKVVAMSEGGSLSGKSLLNIARKLGAQCTLSKPFTQEEFLETVHSGIKS